MSEVVTCRSPYSDLLVDVAGMQVLPWNKIVDMTVKDGLRPTLPDGMDKHMKALIEE